MKNSTKESIDLNRKKLSIKTMYFNRYLFIRYLSAVFFFFNLYWLIALLLVHEKTFIIPALLTIALLPSIFEQAKLYSTHKNTIPHTTRFYWLQLTINIALLPSSLTPLFQSLFPFINQGIEGRSLIILILLFGCLLCLYIQHRLQDISNDNDKHYQRIKQYERSLYL